MKTETTQNKIEALWRKLEDPSTFLLGESKDVLDVVEIRKTVNDLNCLYRQMDFLEGYKFFVDADTIIDKLREHNAKHNSK